MRILIGEISSYKAIVIAAFLKSTYQNIFIITYDYYRSTRFLHTRYSDKHFLLSKSGIDDYIITLSKLCENESIDLFIPVHSNYIGEIIKKKELFGPCFSYCGNYESYNQLHDKLNFHSIAKSLNIPVPDQYYNVESAIIPFVAKPKNKSSAKGVLYIDSVKNKVKLAKENRSDYLYQKFIKGTGCGYSVFTVDGKILSGYGHIRLAEYPVSGGSSIYRAGFYLEEMKTVVDQILSVVKWSGFAMFEFKLIHGNQLILIEANPRIWGSINQGLMNGENYFKYLIPGDAKLQDNSMEKFTYLSPQLYYTFLLYILKGNFKPVRQFWMNRKGNIPDVSLTRDFKGWLSVMLRPLHL